MNSVNNVPVVVVLSADAAIERDREVLWALGPAIVVNPLAPGALRRAVAAALSSTSSRSGLRPPPSGPAT